MCTFLGNTELILSSASDDFTTVDDEFFENFFQIKEFWLRPTICQSNHIIRKWRLKLCELEELIEDFFWKTITLELDNNTDTILVWFITNLRYADNDFFSNEMSYLFHDRWWSCLIGEFMNDDNRSSWCCFLDSATPTHNDRSTSCRVSREDIGTIIDDSSSWEVRSFYKLHQIFDRHRGCISMFQEEINRIDDFSEIMRRDIRCHTDGDTDGTHEQKIWNTSGENRRLSFRCIIVWSKINSFFFDISEHLIGDFTHTSLSITHGRCAISIDGSKVSLTIDQRVSESPRLSETYHCLIHRAITVWMVFTEHISDNFCRFTIFGTRMEREIMHCIKDSSMYRLQSVTDIGQCTRDNHWHGIIDITVLHFKTNITMDIIEGWISRDNIRHKRGNWVG